MASYPDSTYDCDPYKVPTQYKTLYWDQSQHICSETIPRYPQGAVTLPLLFFMLYLPILTEIAIVMHVS